MKKKLIEILPSRVYLHLKRAHYKASHYKRFKNYQYQRKIITNDSYSFKPFDESKSIFVHIPKCAGVSINKSLYGNLAGGHTTFDEYIIIFEPKCIENYFKFTFVRNPWDRVVSAYFFLQRGGFNEQDQEWFNRELSTFDDFDSFVKKWLNEKNIWKWHHFRPQYHYLLDSNNKIKLDYIGYFENIDSDFDFIVKKMGLNIDLPKANSGSHLDYKNYYSEETKNIVANVYAQDIELLGYDFFNDNISVNI